MDSSEKLGIFDIVPLTRFKKNKSLLIEVVAILYIIGT